MRAWIILLTLAGSLAVAGTSPAAAPKTITGTDGPGFTITLKQRGKTVKLLAPGSYTFVVDDMSNIHNFHLTGPGVNKKTGVGATGKFTWHVTLRRGTYKFVCDPHATIMKGKFIVQTP
jgi:copper binding plastocyanin/azurin family protein